MKSGDGIAYMLRISGYIYHNRSLIQVIFESPEFVSWQQQICGIIDACRRYKKMRKVKYFSTAIVWFEKTVCNER